MTTTATNEGRGRGRPDRGLGVRFNLCLSQRLNEAIFLEARRRGITVSKLVRLAVASYLEAEEEED